METRKAARTNISLKIILQIEKKEEQNFSLAGGDSFEVNIIDISLRGVGVFSKYFLPKGLKLKLKIDGKPFGCNEPISIPGEVRYCNFDKTFGYKCGIMFTEILDKYQKLIGDFINSYERRREPRYKLIE